MTDLTVAKLAENLKVPVEHLMDQLERAGHSFEDASQTVPDVAREEVAGLSAQPSRTRRVRVQGLRDAAGNQHYPP